MAQKKIAISEEELAEVVGVYLSGKGWDLYPEVVLQHFGGRADYIGVKQAICAAIECKVSFSYTVLEQLTRWRHEMNQYVSSPYSDETKKAIPHLLIAVVGGSCNVTDLKREIMEEHRIGLIHITCQSRNLALRSTKEGQFDSRGYGVLNGHSWRVHEVIAPRFQPGSRRTGKRIITELNPDMKGANAGANAANGHYMTPFKRTINKAKALLEQGGDWHIAKIVDEINENMGRHHYANDSTARNSIAKFLESFGIATRIEEYRPVFRLAENTVETNP